MLRNCAAILFVCFDMTAYDALSLFSRCTWLWNASRQRRKPWHAKQIALNGPFPLWLKFWSRQKFHQSFKEHHKISNIPKYRLRNVIKCGLYSLAKFAVFQSFCITHGKLTAQSGVGASISRLFKYKMTENCKFRRAMLSAFYNISQRNFGILLILWCSFKLWWNFCLDLSRSKF
jgi:hypothetical protein